MKELNRKKTNKKTYFIIRWLIIFGAIAAWEISARLDLYNTFFTSYPSAIFMDLIEFSASGKLARHTFITMKEAFLGLFYGTSIGILIGVIFAQFDVNSINASCDKQWTMSAVLKIDDHLIYGNDNVGHRIKEKQGRGWIWD